MTLRAGGQDPPLFLVHPVGGSAAAYEALMLALPARQPVYAFQAPGLDGEHETIDRMEALAAAYVELATAVTAGRSCRLGGWSHGGVVAFEMAHQLGRRGHGVEGVVVIDSWALVNDRPPLDEAAHIAELAEGRGVPLSIAELGPLSRRERLTLLAARAREHHVPLPSGAQLAAQVAVFAANRRALARYAFRPIAGRLLLLRAADERGPEPEALGWDALALGEFRVEWVPGDHDTVLSGPNVEQLARRIEAFF